MLVERLRARSIRVRQEKEYREFLRLGNPPWKPGYEQHKQRAIAAAISDPAYDPFHLQAGYGWRLDERVVEYPWFYHLLANGPGKLLDAGSALNHWPLLTAPKIRQKSTFISTLAPEGFSAVNQGVSYVYEDLRDTCFRDDYFDTIACISTLEHVGLDNTMLYTAAPEKKEGDEKSHLDCVKQLRRILKISGTLYLSVPFGIHENHGWFQVFDAGMVDELIEAFAPSKLRETIYRYLPEGWIVADRLAAKEATYFDIHKRQNYEPDYAAASRAVVCLELTK